MTTDRAAMQHLVKTLTDAPVAVAVTDPAVASQPLWEEEAAHIAAAIPARRTEFAAGRQAARKAMAELGLPPQAIAVASDRAPIWPKGIVGSISHSKWLCIAIVARTSDLCGIGIDTEPAEPLPPDMLGLICSDTEWAAIRGPDQGVLARLIFSAKEAAYKAQYPLTKELLEFDHFHVTLDTESARFNVQFQRPAGRFTADDRLCGRFVRTAEHLVTLVTIGQDAGKGV